MGYEKEFRFLLQVQSIVSGERSVCMIHRVRLFVTPRSVVRQAPPSIFSRQEYWSGLSFPTLADLPNPGIEPGSLASPALAGRFLTTEPPGKPT